MNRSTSQSFFAVTRGKIASFFILFFISRVITINSLGVFFDSQEYLTRLANPNYIDALSQGHLPLHSGYIALMWPIYQLALRTPFPPAYCVILAQIILSALSFVFFYKFTKILFNEKIAVVSAVLLFFIPLVWISTVTIMMESVYIPFFIFSLYYALLYSQGKKNHYKYAVISSLSFGISFFTHFGIILWVPLLLYLIFARNRKKSISFSVFLFLAIIVFTLLNSYLIMIESNKTLIESITYLYTGKLNERADLSVSIHSMLVIIRNVIVPTARNYTLLVCVLALISLFRIAQYKRKTIWLFIIWTVPILIVNQWWDSLLIGRHSLPALFALVILTTIIIYKHKIYLLLLMLYLCVTTIPAIMTLNKPIPYLQLSQFVSSLPQDSLYIDSHFARPYIETYRKNNVFFVDEPGYDVSHLQDKILHNLVMNKQVFISSHALSHPYGLYSGPYVHSLTLSYRHDYRLNGIINKFNLKEYKKVDSGNIIIYKITSYSPSPYPSIQSLVNSDRRLDYYDPIIRGWLYLKRAVNFLPL